jgi:hypothetical protein
MPFVFIGLGTVSRREFNLRFLVFFIIFLFRFPPVWFLFVTGLTSLTGYCNDCEVALRSRLRNIHDSDTIGQLAFSVALQRPKPDTAYMELVVDTATNVVLTESTVLELPGAPATQYEGMGTPAHPMTSYR